MKQVASRLIIKTLSKGEFGVNKKKERLRQRWSKHYFWRNWPSNWQQTKHSLRRDMHLVEVKYCDDTQPEQRL